MQLVAKIVWQMAKTTCQIAKKILPDNNDCSNNWQDLFAR